MNLLYRVKGISTSIKHSCPFLIQLSCIAFSSILLWAPLSNSKKNYTSMLIPAFLLIIYDCTITSKIGSSKASQYMISASPNWFEIHGAPVNKHLPSGARFLDFWTRYNIALTLWYTILSCTSFFIPQKTCISRPYCIAKNLTTNSSR